ncbi:MAG TPA: hypothetical protein VGO67_02850 [Verrucomicrobiae bacterium]|jgi:hypothetical protein
MSFWSKLVSGCKAISPDCREASRAQSEELDHPLSPSARLGLSLHLVLCKWCRRNAQQIRYLRKAAHEHEEKLADSGSQKLSSDARERIKRRLLEGKDL